METVRDNTELVANGEWAQALIQVVTAGDLSKQDRVARWTELVYRSVLKSAGDSICDNPAIFFMGFDAGQADLVGRVGRAMLGAP